MQWFQSINFASMETTKKSSLLHSSLVVLLYRLLLVMLFYSISRLVFYAYNQDLLHISDSASLLRIMRGGLTFDVSSMIYLNGLVMLLHLLPLPYKYNRGYQRWTTALYWLFNIPAFIFNLGDTIYYRFTGSRTTLSVFTEFANENPFQFLHFFTAYWHLTLIGVGLILLWVYAYSRLKVSQDLPFKGLRFYMASTISMLVVITLSVGAMRGGFTAFTRPIAPNHASVFISKPEQRAMVLNTPFVMIRLAGKQELPEYQYMSDAKMRELFNPVQQADTTSLHYGEFKGRNVVIIIWESFAREWVGALNQDIPGYKGFTPFVDRLLKDSYFFYQATAGGTKSIDAMPSVLAGIQRPLIPFVSSVYSGNKLNSIASFAGRHGYSTRFYHNAPNGSMGFDAMANQLGYQSYRGKTEYNNDDDYDGHWGIWDEEFLQYIVRDLGTMKQPFLATEFTTSSHEPFNIPERYVARFPKGKIPMHRSIRYSDYALEQFFKTAAKQSWYDNTLFVITADHAVGGALEEYKNPFGGHAVPLIIFDPQGKLKGADDTTNVQQSDIMPTLMALLGFTDKYVAYGQDIFADKPNRFTINTIDNAFQIRQGDYLLQYDGTQVLGLYDVRQDRMLKHDLKAEKPEVVSRMLPLFQAFLQDFGQRMRGNKLSLD